jgi:hypothetical protein
MDWVSEFFAFPPFETLASLAPQGEVFFDPTTTSP